MFGFTGPQKVLVTQSVKSFCKINPSHNSCNDFLNVYLEVDLEGEGVVTGLKTEGGSGPDKTVTSFKVKVGTTECGMDYIRVNGDAKVSKLFNPRPTKVFFTTYYIHKSGTRG